MIHTSFGYQFEWINEFYILYFTVPKISERKWDQKGIIPMIRLERLKIYYRTTMIENMKQI